MKKLMPHAMKLNIPIKEESEDEVDLMLIGRSPHDNDQGGAPEPEDVVENIPPASRESEMESDEDEEIKQKPADVIFSLCNKEYKAALKEHIEAVAEMKREGKDHDINERADALMKQFEAKKQAGNGRYLKFDRYADYYETIDKDVARKKIYSDISRESTAFNNKRRLECATKSTLDHAKRSKTVSGENVKPTPTTSESLSSRPKRAVQQLKDRTENLPYKEHKLPGSNPIGMAVTGYSKNTNFKARLVEDKYLCAGQAFAKQLIERPGWNVKACRIDEGRSDFVIYKECHFSNSNEWDAKEGVGKFTGYDKLAKYLYQKGGVEELANSSMELKDILVSLGLRCSDETAAVAVLNSSSSMSAAASSGIHCSDKTAAVLNLSSSMRAAAKATEEETNGGEDRSHNNNESLGTVQASMDMPLTATQNNNSCTETFESNAAPKNSNQTVENPSLNQDILIAKRNELKEAKREVSEKLAKARARYISLDETWKRDNTVDFFNTLNQWLIRMVWEVESFNSAEFQRDIDEFESCMAELEAAEENSNDDNVEFHRGMVRSWVEVVKKKFLSCST